jgi:hypothetical protein
VRDFEDSDYQLLRCAAGAGEGDVYKQVRSAALRLPPNMSCSTACICDRFRKALCRQADGAHTATGLPLRARGDDRSKDRRVPVLPG